jgi:phenylalanyl-tRNA synthetase beta chain
MQVSYKWLKDYVDCPLSAADLADSLTAAGIAVDRVENLGDDAVLELDLTPNRGDCLGMVNLAYEVAALSGNTVRRPEIALQENQARVEDYITLRVDNVERCPRFAGRIIKNLRIAPSPDWMQERLTNSGIRPINNVVDITNYVMLELNQPLHAYDYDFFTTKEVVVRTARPGEKMTTLDDAVQELQPDDLLITEAGVRPVGLAGVMGGQNSQVLDSTTMIFLEAAHFERIGIRKTAKRLNMRSEASIRFEKACDVVLLPEALDRAAYLMQEYAGGVVVGGRYDLYPQPQAPQRIELRIKRIQRVLGVPLTEVEVRSCLERLALRVAPAADNSSAAGDTTLLVEVPSWRIDLEAEVDLIEEVARIYGYDRIPLTFPVGQVTPGNLTPEQAFRDQVRNFLAQEWLEVINYSFISPQAFDQFALPADSPLRESVSIANPLAEDQSVMRTFLLPGLLETAAHNIARQNQGLTFFELGNVFHQTGDGIAEHLALAGVVSGEAKPNWLKNHLKLDFYYAKGVADALLAHFRIEAAYVAGGAPAYYHPGCSAALVVDGKTLGFLGVLHPEVLKQYALKDSLTAWECDLEALYTLTQKPAYIRGFSKFPAVSRDLALLVPATVPAGSILETIARLQLSYLHATDIFDVYSGEQVPAGYKSVAVNLVFQSQDQTLTEKEVADATGQIAAGLRESLGAEIRG